MPSYHHGSMLRPSRPALPYHRVGNDAFTMYQSWAWSRVNHRDGKSAVSTRVGVASNGTMPYENSPACAREAMDEGFFFFHNIDGPECRHADALVSVTCCGTVNERFAPPCTVAPNGSPDNRARWRVSIHTLRTGGAQVGTMGHGCEGRVADTG
jgi:hypothetical protein